MLSNSSFFLFFLTFLSLFLFSNSINIPGCIEGGKTYRMGFIYSSDIKDFGWSFGYERSRNEFEKQVRKTGCPLETRFTNNVPLSEYKTIAEKYAQQGFDIIVGNTFDFYFAVVKPLASKYPNVTFFNIGAVSPFPPNFIRLLFDFGPPRFLLGMICGGVTKTNIVGYIAPCKKSANGTCQQINSFELGVYETNPSATVEVILLEDFTEPITASVAAEVLKSRGADCISAQENTLAAEKRFISPTTWVMGGTTDTRFLLGERVGSSASFNLVPIFTQILTEVINGTITQNVYTGTMENSGVSIAAFSDELKDDPELIRRVEDMRDAFVNGTDNVFCGTRIRQNPLYPDPPEGQECLTWAQSYLDKVFNQSMVLYTLQEEDVIQEIYISFDTTLGLVTLIVLLVLWLGNFVTLLTVCYYRNTHRFRRAAPFFLVLILVGVTLGETSIFVWLFKPSKVTCNLRIWFAAFGFSLIYSPLVFKNYRIMVIFNTKSLEIFKISNLSLVKKGVFPFTLVVFLILLLWVIIDPLEAIRHHQSYLDPEEVELRCTSDRSWGWICLLVVGGLLLLYGSYIAYKTRNAASEFRESKSIALSVYNCFLVGIGTLILLLVLDSQNVYVEEGILIYALLIVFVCPYVFIFTPLLWGVFVSDSKTISFTLDTVTGTNKTSKKSSNQTSGHTTGDED